MKPLSFIIIGSGWRARFYIRIAKQYPEQFQLAYLLCRREEKVDSIARELGIKTTTSKELSSGRSIERCLYMDSNAKSNRGSRNCGRIIRYAMAYSQSLHLNGRKSSERKVLFQIVNYKIQTKTLPKEFDGFRIVHLSDLHGAVYGDKNKKLIQKIHEVRPQMIAMTGDMTDHSENSISGLIGLCGRLSKRYPVYYIPGNHEQCLEPKQLSQLLRKLESLGTIVLENSWCTISYKGAFVKLYGLVMPIRYYKDPLRPGYAKNLYFSEEDTRKLLGEPDLSCYKILLSHNPLYYPSYRNWGADLTLSGHIHGGIIRIPKLGGLLSPDMTFFPKYDGGLFTEKGKHLIVSRGLGNHFLIRIRNPEELVVVTLHHLYD